MAPQNCPKGSHHPQDVAKPDSTSTEAGDILPLPVLQNDIRPLSRRRMRSQQRLGKLSSYWTTILKHLGPGTAPSTTSAPASACDSRPAHTNTEKVEEEQQEVDEIIVDRSWSDGLKTSDSQSEHGVTPPKSGGSQRGSHLPPSVEVEASQQAGGFWTSNIILIVLRYRIWLAIVNFFSSRFSDAQSEDHYQQENWFTRKSLALWSAVFFIINWILGIAFVPRPLNILDKIFHWGVSPSLSIPVLVFVMYDFPRDRPNFYQIFVCASTWVWAFYLTLNLYLCGYMNSGHAYFSCGHKDFLGIFYYSTAIPTIALFGLKLNRLPVMIGGLLYMVVSCVLIIPYRVIWARLMINFLVYLIFLLYTHYMRENAERRLYTLREQLKVQFKAAQKAQVNERTAADSKRRLTSYVFHDNILVNHLGFAQVRVPLNTALLAVQNMEASGTVAKSQEIEFKALEGSLSMMSKVLNDVLDFNRMDSGRFESVSKPYAFHQVMRSLFVPLRLATNARGLELVTDLDPSIDQIARRAAYAALGSSSLAIEEYMKRHPEEDGIVVGDETRLRQIVTNLASNACKFTQTGGKISVSTKLIAPVLPHKTAPSTSDIARTPPTSGDQLPSLSSSHLSEHDLHTQSKLPLDWIAVRIEVSDTGCGIQRADMVGCKLFSAFNQTEMGRQQGGKGTGLGLALVRQIVALSGGRLGLQSKIDEGSTFWVELPLGVGRKAIPLVEARPSSVANSISHTPLRPNDEVRGVYINGGSAQDATVVPLHIRPSVTTRPPSAMHSLMEQGGRVELLLSKHESHSLLTHTMDDIFPLAQHGMPPSLQFGDRILSRPKRPSVEGQSRSTETARPPPTKRPSHLPLPRKKSFNYDDNPPTSASPIQSGQFGNDGAMFDRGMKVLVVDDDPWTRTLMQRMLTRLGCKVATAENGEVALEMILGPADLTPSSELSNPISDPSTAQGEESRFSVVFLDNQMPVLSGLNVVSRLREMGRHDFVVGVTGNALLTDQEEYLAAGADCVLTKPVRERSLKGMLSLAGERRKPL